MDSDFIINTLRENDWFMCSYVLSGGAVAIGYGNTPDNAKQECLRDVAVITRLRKELL